MKKSSKLIASHNGTLDRFVIRGDSNQQVRKHNKIMSIRVPPSSGLPPSKISVDPVLLYPLNPEFRQYQQQIVSSCVCRNTLVCLPTGLGKTHIAAILIANFFRWFPNHKIVFLAPTRPLVRQQISALLHLQDQVPRQFVFEANGQLPPHKRQNLYSSHRVIFATPQTIENDLKAGRIEGTKVILLIFDECHRSVGNSSYAQIVRLMNKLQVGFRIIGLSATPGSENQKIQQVITNLNIARMIYKDEHDLDVRKYLHQRIVKEVEISETNIIKQSLQILEFFAKPSFGCLICMNLIKAWIARRGLAGTSFFLIREQCNSRMDELMPSQKQVAYSALKILGFLFRCRKALNDQGYQTFKRQFFAQFSKPNPNSQNSSDITELLTNQDMLKLQAFLAQIQSATEVSHNLPSAKDRQLIQNDQTQISVNSQINQNSFAKDSKSNSKNSFELPKSFRQKVQGTDKFKRIYELFHQGNNKSRPHPKLQQLAEILTDFFRKQQGKAMVFTNFKVTSKQIKQYLSAIQQIKAQLFFGQSKTVIQEEQQYGESFVLQLKQKQQLEVIEKYKKGEINTLISTCIGEEGLDIGQVDCIIFYDGGHSPIRSIQRRGRTGRKRTGYVYILLMEGKQLAEYKKGKTKQTQMKNILKKSSMFQYYPFNSSLFQQNSQILIQNYNNILQKIQSGKKTKSIVQKDMTRDSDVKETKYRAQYTKVYQNENGCKFSQVQCNERHNQIYSRNWCRLSQPSNINNILQKYKKSQQLQAQQHQIASLQQQESIPSYCINPISPQHNNEIQKKLNIQTTTQVNMFSHEEQEQKQLTKQNQALDDDFFQQFEKYRLRKLQTNKQQIEDNTSVLADKSYSSSMSSQQMLQILHKLKDKPKPQYDLQDYADI